MTLAERKFEDVSADFRPDRSDSATMRKILPHEGTPEAVRLLDRYAYRLTDYGYWFLLSTLWVSHTDGTDLQLWKRLFSSSRKSRETSIMKPSELAAYRALPDTVQAFRAHRPNESDWIAYSIDPRKAALFTAWRGSQSISEYQVSKTDVLALFLRRQESEIIVLDKERAKFSGTIDVVKL